MATQVPYYVSTRAPTISGRADLTSNLTSPRPLGINCLQWFETTSFPVESNNLIVQKFMYRCLPLWLFPYVNIVYSRRVTLKKHPSLTLVSSTARCFHQATCFSVATLPSASDTRYVRPTRGQCVLTRI